MVKAIVLTPLLSSPIQEASERAKQTGTLSVTLTYCVLVGLVALMAG